MEFTRTPGKAHGQRVTEFLVTAFVNALHQREHIVHEHIHMPILFDNELRKLFENILLGKVSHKAGILADINIGDQRAFLFEFTHDGCPDSMGPARHNDHFIFERFHGYKYTTIQNNLSTTK